MTTPRPVEDVLEDAEFLDDSGVGAIEAAQRLGFPTPHSLEKWLERHGAARLWQRMKARDPEGWHHQVKKGVRPVSESVDTIALLLEQARKHGKARIRGKAEKVATLVDELRSAIAADAEAERAREKARKDVERLERELAAAKARLRGGETGTSVGPSAAEVRAWAAENGLACPATGRIPNAVREAFDAANDGAAA